MPLRSTGDLSVTLTKRASNTATAHNTCTHLQDQKQNMPQSHVCKHDPQNQRDVVNAEIQQLISISPGLLLSVRGSAHLSLLARCKAPPLNEHRQQLCKIKRDTKVRPPLTLLLTWSGRGTMWKILGPVLKTKINSSTRLRNTTTY